MRCLGDQPSRSLRDDGRCGLEQLDARGAQAADRRADTTKGQAPFDQQHLQQEKENQDGERNVQQMGD